MITTHKRHREHRICRLDFRFGDKYPSVVQEPSRSPNGRTGGPDGGGQSPRGESGQGRTFQSTPSMAEVLAGGWKSLRLYH